MKAKSIPEFENHPVSSNAHGNLSRYDSIDDPDVILEEVRDVLLRRDDRT